MPSRHRLLVAVLLPLLSLAARADRPLPAGARMRIGDGRWYAPYGHAVGWSADGQRVRCYGWGELRGFDAASGALLTSTVIGAHIRQAQLSTDGRRLLIVRDETAALHELGGRQLNALRLKQRIVASALAPDGHTAALAAGDRALHVVDLADGRLLHSLAPAAQRISALGWDRRGTCLAIGDTGGGLRSWRPGGAPRAHPGHQGAVHAVAFSPADRWLASAGADRWVRTTDLTASARGGWRVPTPARALAFSPDGRTLAIGGARELTLLDQPAGAQPVVVGGLMRPILSLAWRPDGQQLAIGEAGLRLWTRGRAGLVPTAWPGPVAGLAFAGGDRLAVAGVHPEARLLDLKTGAVAQRLPLHPAGWPWGRVRRHLRGAGGRVALLVGRELMLWDPTRGAARRWSVPLRWGSSHFALGPDGRRLAYVGDDTRIRRWTLDDPPDGEPPIGWRRKASVRALALSGTHLAAADRAHAIRLYRLADRALVTQLLPRPRRRIDALAFSPDGTRLAAARLGGNVDVWSVPDGRRVARLTPTAGSAGVLAWSPDGRRLAAGNEDHTVHLWQRPWRGPPRRLAGHAATVTALDWSADGRQLASGSDDRTVLVWDVAE